MKQTYKALFRFSILLILGGLFKTFHLINVPINVHNTSTFLLIREARISSDFFLNKTNSLPLELSLGHGSDVTEYISLSSKQSGNFRSFLEYLFTNLLKSQTWQINQILLGKIYQPKILFVSRQYQPNTLKHNFCPTFFCSELYLEYLATHKSEFFLLFLSLITGGVAAILYAVYKLKPPAKITECCSSQDLNYELKKYLKNNPKVKQLIAEDKILVDSSGNILFVANNLLKKLGYNCQELLGKKVDCLLGSSDFIFADPDLTAKSHQVVNQIQKVLKCKKGEKIISLLSWVVLRKKNQTRGAILVVTDITEHQNLKQAWRNEKKFRQLTETVNIATFIYQDKKFIYVNSAMAMLTGYSKKSLLKMNFWQVIHPDCHKMLKQGLRKNKNSQQPSHWQGEIKMLTKTGEEPWVYLTVSLIQLDQKIGLLCTAFDLSDRKHMEQIIKSSEQRYRNLIELSPAVIFVHKKGKCKTIFT